MKHAIACLNTQIGILLHNASVFHGEGREEDRDRSITEADDLRMAVEALKDEIPFEGFRPHDSWEETTSSDADFYRSIVTRIGELYGYPLDTCEPGGLIELVETSVNQFRLLASFVGSKATSHTEIVSDTAAEIRALRVSLEAERQRTLEAERKLADATKEIRELRVTKLEHDVQVQLLVAAREKAEARAEYFKLAYEKLAEETPKQETEYRMLEVGEVTEPGDEVRTACAWMPLTGYHNMRQRISERGSHPVGYYRRPISLDTKPENPETPAA